MAENVDNAKDTEEASCVTDKAVDKEKESEPISSNKEEIDEECTNEKTESECQEDSGEVESCEKKTDDNHENGGEEVVTLDDEGGDEERVPTKTIPDPVFFESVSEEEKQYYEENPISADKIELMKVQCTACFKQVNHHVANNIQRHPELGVPICRNCKHFYEDGDWEKDEEGSDVFCRWCGNGGEVVGCDKCKVHVFCKRCITRNCGRSKFAEINDTDEWACFTCEPSQIFKERNLMRLLSLWAAERKRLKRTGRKEKDTPKKKEKMMEEKKRKREEMMRLKHEEEISKVENFIDENIHEAFDTLAIYQKCLEDERRKWIRARKSMNATNAATAAKSLRRIYEITRQNMELLDHSLVEGYTAVFPDDAEKRLKFSTEPKSPGKRKTKETVRESSNDDIEVEGVVINGDTVYAANGGDDDEVADFDPSMLCSVEITAERDSDSTPTPRGPPLKKKRKLGNCLPAVGPASVQGRMKISNKFLKKKSPKKKFPVMKKAKKRKMAEDGEIEEITIDDDSKDSVGYVSQSELESRTAANINKKANKFINGDTDDDFDSDVSLE